MLVLFASKLLAAAIGHNAESVKWREYSVDAPPANEHRK